MWFWASMLLVIALLAAFFGFERLGSAVFVVAKITFVVSLVLAVLWFILGRRRSAQA